MYHRRRAVLPRLLAPAALLLLAACSEAGPGPLATVRGGPLADASPPPYRIPGVIVFSGQSPDDSVSALYRIGPTGPALTRLTPGEWPGEYNPDWSPDGQRLVFEHNLRLHVMNADGSGLRELPAPEDSHYPRWSPDGTRIAFQVRGGRSELRVMNADGTGATTLLSVPADHHVREGPRWSPDGSRIAVSVADGDSDSEIFIVAADGSGATRLGVTLKYQIAPEWSPDGSRIAFMAARGDDLGIFVADADGTDLRFVAEGLSSQPPNWHPDGRTLLYEGQAALWTVDTETGAVTRLTHRGQIFTGPEWSPDGRSISAIRYLRPNLYDLVVMNADGSGIRQLTRASFSRILLPRWRPR